MLFNVAVADLERCDNRQNTEEEWREKDVRFERNMRRKGYVIKKMGEDGACLFRAVADQLYGDEEMHQGVRTQCMDYIVSLKNAYCRLIERFINDHDFRREMQTTFHSI